MSILRTYHQRNYSQIDNALLQDKRLSRRAKGLAAELYSLPPNWEISIKRLASTGPEGQTAIATALKELATYGYMMRTRERTENGKITTVTHLTDWPAFENVGTPESRTIGYENAVPTDVIGNPDPPFSDPSETDGSENDPSENDPSERWGSLKRRSTKDDIQTTTDTSYLLHEQPTPSESPKPPTPPRTRARAHTHTDIETPKLPTPQQELFGAICVAVGWDSATLTQSDRAQVAQAAGILSKAGYTAEDVHRFSKEVWAKDWRFEKKGQLPTLRQLRQEIGKLKSGAKNGTGNGYMEKDEEFDPEFIRQFAENHARVKRERAARAAGGISLQ